MKKSNPLLKKNITAVVSVVVVCVLSAILNCLFIFRTSIKIVEQNKNVITPILLAVYTITAVLTVLFYFQENKGFYKTGLVTLILLLITSIILYILEASGVLYKIDSVEDLREFISSYGGWSVVIFLIVQIMQVTVVPIPGVVAIGAGVLLFGPFVGALLSFVGITMGSVIAFYIGRCLGYRVASWLVGEEDLKKAMNAVKGKDKVILTFMFLFPFFPDDLLCFVAGLSSMSPKFFLIMITVTRLVSTFTTAYSVNGSLIPYDTWWGIIIWAVLIVGCILLVKAVYKNSDKIENFFKRQKK